MNVLLTIDTEVHAIHPDWRSDHLRRDIRRDIEGIVGNRCAGIDYQLDLLARHGLKGTFMVEPLFSGAPGVEEGCLSHVVHRLRSAGHDVQLHIHCEWIANYPAGAFGFPYRGHLQRYYSLSEQEQIIHVASRLLQDSGAPAPIAFRAGGYAANLETMDALAGAGIRFDTSFNVDFAPAKCTLPAPPSLGAAFLMRGVQEYPVAAFEDYPGHFRPLQICACGGRELIHALEQAEQCGWGFVVIVGHSFEMLAGRREGKLRIREEVVSRMQQLCMFLGENKNRFRTVGFDDLQNERIDTRMCPPNIRGALLNTAGRTVSQAMNRVRGLLG